MRSFEIEINGVAYTGNTASAKNQAEALHMAVRTGLIASIKSTPADMTLAAMFGMVDYKDFQKFVSLLVKGNIQRQEDNVEAAENLFIDNIQDWYLLVGKVLAENLGPFWKLQLQTENRQSEKLESQTD